MIQKIEELRSFCIAFKGVLPNYLLLSKFNHIRLLQELKQLERLPIGVTLDSYLGMKIIVSATGGEDILQMGYEVN